MTYFKVRVGDMHDYFTGWTTIKDELLTPKERHTRFRYLPNYVFEEVEVSREQTYTCFGSRFEIHKEA